MSEQKIDLKDSRWLNDRWLLCTLAVWLLVATLMIAARLPGIEALALGDTDDNLRLAQVRAMLGGQPWFDLTQYRLAPPAGADIHWSHLPDLPIAGLILLLEPLLGHDGAERWAVGLAPLIPFAIGLVAIALTARRLIAPIAWTLALLATLCAGILMPMWMPLRIDHHGWQLALLAVAIAGLADPKPARGGTTSGLATALSLTIGLEMLAFLALIGAATALFWVRDRAHAPRIAGYGAALGGGSALGFALFASAANRAPVCDALSPVWLSAVAAAGGALVLLSLLRTENWRIRFALAAAAGAILAIGFALLWPHCLGRPEGVSPELQSLWLDNVQEARPIYRQGWRKALLIVSLPLSGLAGYAIALIGARRAPEKFLPWLALAAMALASVALLFWQVRTAPAAQLLAIPGAAILGGWLLPRFRASQQMLVRVFGSVAAIALMTGLYAVIPIAAFPEPPGEDETHADASGETLACSSREALAPIAALPASTILTQIDFGPRLIVMTPHNAIAGPYHRNGEAMLDIFDAFRGDEARLRETVQRYDVGYVLICPDMGGDWLYGEEDEASMFYRMRASRAPAWLEPVSLPEDSPFLLWRVAR
ncbi:AcrB/AcrD/AcrF family protein [Parasphingopyxis marina]|uniref:AcrB/AcrD/AcrF family protein n=1 Tax=Parasphingopyxis marina TaxID=2761622 RepID=A0A842HQX0_9SPHN|nr:AcrB/AcrD/AcrF family protein [Parasphingopyxis marina]MBC2776158.1 AcrB/AcrD/AcrF family protein [Parasphingopyxis marina]